MVVGSMWCSSDQVTEIKDRISLIKRKHAIPSHREIKWTKVSKAKQEYYEDLVKLFFEIEGLNFRATVIPTGQLQHDLFNQSVEDFYYKMQYTMLTNIVRKRVGNFKIYLDYKDTWSHVRSQKLVEYLRKKVDFIDRSFSAQPIRSYESSIIQLADLFIGAVAAKNGGYVAGHTAKAALIKIIEEEASQQLNIQSPYGVDKFNILLWRPKQAQEETSSL